MNDPLTIIAAHCADTLPDSIESRKELLNALKSFLRGNHPALPKVLQMIAAIERMETLQPLLSAEFQNLLSEKPKGSR